MFEKSKILGYEPGDTPMPPPPDEGGTPNDPHRDEQGIDWTTSTDGTRYPQNK